MQTEEVCRAAGAVCGVGSVCIYGGVPKGPQKQALREGARVVVATPGRLLDLAQEGALSLGGVDYLVRDWATRPGPRHTTSPVREEQLALGTPLTRGMAPHSSLVPKHPHPCHHSSPSPRPL